MTDTRKKLIELLKVPIHPHLDADPVEVVADYLIANGVTFATDNNDDCKWIPVSERLPEDGVQVLACTKHGKAFPAHCERRKWRVSHSVTITHWMPLPLSPKEVGHEE